DIRELLYAHPLPGSQPQHHQTEHHHDGEDRVFHTDSGKPHSNSPVRLGRTQSHGLIQICFGKSNTTDLIACFQASDHGDIIVIALLQYLYIDSLDLVLTNYPDKGLVLNILDGIQRKYLS